MAQAVQVSEDVEVPPLQTCVDSIVQVDEHPSKLAVFPSSHSSVPTRSPSLHTLSHASLLVFTINPTVQNSQVSWLVEVPPLHA